MKTKHASIALGLSALMVLTFLCTVAGSATHGMIKTSDGDREDWFDSRWHHRLFVQVNATDHVRDAYPIDMLVDFSGHVPSGSIVDANSIRVLDNGTVIPSQYDKINNTAGNVIFVINETVAVDEIKNYTVYFDTEANGLKPVSDYGEPTYVTEYETLAEEGKFLGSSPLNGSTDSWFFPPGLNYNQYDYQDRKVGDVKTVWTAWGDGWNGTDWIRHYARAVAYRDSFNVYLTAWNNATDSNRSWASGLLNISTGSPPGVNDSSKDGGLHVLTNNWDVPNVSAIDYGCCPVLASASIDTYNQILNKTYTFTFQGGNTSTVVIEPESNAIQLITGVRNLTLGNNSLLDPSEYDGYNDTSGDGVQFNFTAVPGESFEVNYTVKKYDWDDRLRVNAKNGTMEYVIMYDSDDPSGTPYTNPDIGAILFPEEIAASNMVIEFWENRSLGAPGDAFFDYYLNISTNYREWWYNTTNDTVEYQHELQENEFEMIFSYYNDTLDPEQDTVDFLASYRDPADVTIMSFDDAIPISLVVHAPLDGQTFNGWSSFPTIPLDEDVTINVTVGGETIDHVYYKLQVDGAPVFFSGSVEDIPLDTINGDALDGRIVLYIGVQDTNGTIIEESFRIFIVKTWYQSFFSTLSTISIVIVSAIGALLAMCGLGAIKRKRARSSSL